MSPRLHSETARQRELYKYWQPNESVFPSAEYDESFNYEYQPRPSYDSALTAYAQLGALRCNVKRGMISVVDQDYQYIIAEGTKTLSLQDGTVADQDDQLWFGLRTIPRSMGICATALGQFTTVGADGQSGPDTLYKPLQFVIPDLSKDARFVNQPFVCGTPYLRFYAGVPIYSPAGHIIGIYSIVDDKPRDNFGEQDLNVLKDLAATVMDHLVLGTVRGRHHRADRMVKGLGLFVEGKATLRDWWLRSGHLAKGPTTKDGSRGDWTLKAQADAEFGPQLETSSHAHEEQKSFSLELRGVNKTGRRSTFPAPVDAALCSVPDRMTTHDQKIPGDQDPNNVILKPKSGEPGFADSQILGPLPTDTIRSSHVQHPNFSGSIGQENENVSTNEGATLTTPQNMRAMFNRASNLIRESINVEGCFFLDADTTAVENTPFSPGAEIDESPASRSVADRRPSKEEINIPAIAVDEIGQRRKSNYFQPDPPPPRPICEVLGFSQRSDLEQSDEETKSRIRFPKEFLHGLVKKYPSGSILNFEHDGSIYSSDNDVDSSSSHNLIRNKSNSRRKHVTSKTSLGGLDVKIVTDTFPGIRCLAFLPLWDTGTKSWFCGALAWTKDPLRILDPEDDMAYLAAFGNSIMAEKARLDASVAGRMKDDFISTVSHELRSPLHGILASAELLKDMTISPAQVDVIKMISICGRTLLDTINHVLAFTELNRLRKPKLSETRKSSGDLKVSKQENPPASDVANQITHLDLSLLVEEVVDSTLAGYNFGRSDPAAILSSAPSLRSSEVERSSHEKTTSAQTNAHVKVIMDIDWRSSWAFDLQPGPWRRIVMNLVGNALKYTKAGHICVSLQSTDNVLEHEGRESVILTVADTGKGISEQFLKHHVFTPFLQEDTLAPGTGLGLSIVRQIVHDLDGQIDIKSEEGSGTTVTIQIPLRTPTPSSDTSHVQADIVRLESVRQKMKGLKVYVAPSKSSSSIRYDDLSKVSEIDVLNVALMKKSLRKMLKHWFGLELVEAPSISSADADIFFLLEDELTTSGAAEDRGKFAWKPEVVQLAKTNSLIVLRTAPASLSKMMSEIMRQSVPFIQQPFGPNKFITAFDAFLQQKAMPTPTLVSQLSQVSTVLLPTRNSIIDTTAPGLILSTTQGRVVDIKLNSEIDPSPTVDTAPLIIPQFLGPLPPLTVLLVEDNEINLKLLVMYMRKLKYPYLTAVNGLEALEIFKKNPLPLRFILMDISMPVMDGLTSTREIRRHEQELGLPPATILALTGASSINAREKAILSGVDIFLTKPVPLKILRGLIAGTKQSFDQTYAE